MPYSSYDHDKLEAAETMRIERRIYFEAKDREIAPYASLPIAQLLSMRSESAAAEQAIFDDLKERAAAWEEQAGRTLLLDKTLEYVRTPHVQHTARTNDAALWRAAVALMHLVIFHISRIKKFTDKAQEAFIFDSLAEDANHDIMVDIVKEAFNVSLHKPFAPCKAILNHSQGCVTAFIGSKAVGGVLKAVFIDGFQQHTDNFLYQLVVNGRDAQRTEFSILFGNICPSGRLGLVRFVFQGCNKPVNSFKAHCVNGFPVCACGHVSLTGIDILIRL